MARLNAGGYPRQLACQAVLKKDRRFVAMDGRAGRCGSCKACWRLFVHVMRREGRPLPRASRSGAIAGFHFTYRAEEKPPRNA